LSHCKIHENAYGDSRCNDYRKANQGSNKVNQGLNKSEIPTGSDDCISRQDVLSEIIRFSTEEGSSVECQQLYCDVNNMPSVTPQEPRWIPVSERLPQEAFGCLVTVIDTDVHTQEEFENILPYFVGYDGETWNDADGEPISFEVIAWMPLPEPYREVEE
jgi:hypothetical protein